MRKIAIITDTDASLPADISRQYRIRQVPIMLQFGEESLRAVYDIDDAEVFARIDREKRLPTTAAPAPGQFAETFQEAFDQGAEQVLCFTVSSEVSATWKSANAAREMMPDRDITVVDTRSLSLGQGLIVLTAAEAVAQGASKEEALQIALDTRERTYLFAALSTLKYLAMSGRVGHLAAGMANILNIRPILTIQDGKLEMLEKVRTRNKAWARLIALAEEQARGKRIARMGLLHAAAPEDMKAFESRLCATWPCQEERLYAEMTPGLSVHAGAGLVGMAFVVE